MKTFMTCLLLAFVVVACRGSKPGSTSEPPRPEPAASVGLASVATPVSADERCDKNDDCVAVEVACCDHCNGGTAKAFNKAAASKHKPTGCEQQPCTRMACAPVTAKCVDHRCVL